MQLWFVILKVYIFDRTIGKEIITPFKGNF